jgi:hypothetical protein
MNYDTDTDEGMANSVAWTERMFGMMNDGAVWHIPRSSTTVRVYPSKKEVVITGGVLPEESLTKVIKVMGWAVKEKGNGHEVS